MFSFLIETPRGTKHTVFAQCRLEFREILIFAKLLKHPNLLTKDKQILMSRAIYVGCGGDFCISDEVDFCNERLTHTLRGLKGSRT